MDANGQTTELDEITPDDRRLITTAAVKLFREYGDEDDILSERQVNVLERLAPLTDSAKARDLALMEPDDLDTILTTAVELVDKHGIDEEALADAVARHRHLTALDAWKRDEDQ
ncbi:hypothetical protein [Streptomyces sp. NPDC059631]|uniref:hypothetical protein n=1 Tax=unclassified Streptomyces TaxID=2593676 RepID=UPI0036B7E32B